MLSLCDGISGGQLALQRLGIKVNKYYASEIKDIAIKTVKYNFPDTIHIGNVTKVSYSNGILQTENGNYEIPNIDLVIFGSPYQSFSIANITKHRIGLEDKQKSGLFYECYRILNEVQPKYFLMENMASMKNQDKDYISELLGVQPININSSLVSPCLRNRYYWTNIPNVTQPVDKKITLQSILECGYTNRIKGRCLTVQDSKPNKVPVKMFHRYCTTGFTNLIFKSEEHYQKCCDYYNTHYKGKKAIFIPNYKTDIFDGVRYLTQKELERCQTVPEGYTKCLTRNQAADVLGDGWTIDVIAHIFKNMKF